MHSWGRRKGKRGKRAGGQGTLTSRLGGGHSSPVEGGAIPGYSPHLAAGANGDGDEGLVRAHMQPGGTLGAASSKVPTHMGPRHGGLQGALDPSPPKESGGHSLRG